MRVQDVPSLLIGVQTSYRSCRQWQSICRPSCLNLIYGFLPSWMLAFVIPYWQDNASSSSASTWCGSMKVCSWARSISAALSRCQRSRSIRYSSSARYLYECFRFSVPDLIAPCTCTNSSALYSDTLNFAPPVTALRSSWLRKSTGAALSITPSLLLKWSIASNAPCVWQANLSASVDFPQPARRGAMLCPVSPQGRRKAPPGPRRGPRNREVEPGERHQALLSPPSGACREGA